MRICLCQLSVDDGEPPEQRADRALALIESQQGRADLVVLPELWVSGAFNTSVALATAEPLDGPILTAVGAAAARAGVHVLAGSVAETAPEATGGKPYNTAVLFGPDGSRLLTYRKIHLFGFDGGEAGAFAAGDEPVVWDSPWGTFGLATCYDLRFPELFRALVDRGAEGFLIPTGWPTTRIARWDLLTQAPAVENQAWVISVNEVGGNGGHEMGGHSIVINPLGEVLARLGEGEEVADATVDLRQARQWRQRSPPWPTGGCDDGRSPAAPRSKAHRRVPTPALAASKSAKTAWPFEAAPDLRRRRSPSPRDNTTGDSSRCERRRHCRIWPAHCRVGVMGLLVVASASEVEPPQAAAETRVLSALPPLGQ